MIPDSVVQVRCRRSSLASTLAVRVWAVGGSLAEIGPGVALASGRMLVEGSRERTWERIASDAEARGMDIGASGGPEVVGVSIDALAADWKLALEWAAELTLGSSFPAERCGWIVRQATAELASLSEQPEVVGGWAFLDQLYSPHPLGRPLHGSAKSLARLTRQDMVAFHRQSLCRGVIVSVVGDIDPDAAQAEVERLFASLRSEGASQPAVDPPPSAARLVRRLTVPNSDQAHLYLGQLTVPIAHPDRIALELAAVILGAGPGLAGRIPTRVREAEGLAYVAQVATTAGAGIAPGRLSIYLATSPSQLEAARASVLEELDKVLSDGVSPEEFEGAREYLLGSAPFRRETARQLATLQARACLYRIPLDQDNWLSDQLADLDARAVNSALQRHLDLSKLSATIALPGGAGSSLGEA